MSNRSNEWRAFADIVAAHVDNYTIPQWGDAPDDQLEGWSVEQCFDAIQRYVNRRNSNRRGDLEAFRDLVKIAHYACVAFTKKWKGLCSSDELATVQKIMEGGI